MKNLLGFFTIVGVFLFHSYTLAATSSGITYHGRLLKPDGTAVASNTQFKIQIRTPGTENCLMYEETQAKDLSTTNGMFSITINDGSGTRTDSGLYTMNQIFANRGTFTFPVPDCGPTNTYTPATVDGRSLKVYFNDGSFAPGTWEPMPTQAVNFVPMAIESYSTGGFTAKSLLRVEDGATLGNVSSLTTANFNELMALILGTSTQYAKAGQLNGSALPALTNGQTLGWNGSAWSAVTPLTSESDPTVKAFAKSNLPTCSVGEVLKADGTSFSCVTDAGGWTASDATTSAKGIVQISATGGIDVNAGVIQLSDVGTSGDYYKVHTDAKGRVTSGSTSLVEADIPTLTTAGKVSGSAITSGTIGGSTNFNSTGSVFGNIISGQSLRIFEATNTHKITVVAPSALSTDYTMTLPLDKATVNGQVLTSDTSGALSWTTVSGGGGTVTSVTSGGTPIVVGGTTAAPTVSVSAASTSATGVVQLAANGGTTSGTVVQADDSRLTNGRAPTGSASGDLSGTYPGPTVSGISGKPVLYTSIASGQYLKYDGTNIINANIAIGDVTNLTTQLSNKLDASNMPANCAAGSTLTFSSPTGAWACTAIVVSASNFGSQSQNTFLAGPTSGSGTPSFRAITAADLPASASYWSAATGGINYAGGNVGIGTNSPNFKLELAGTGSPADSKIGVNGTQVVYLPDQTSFTGSIFVGDSGGSLSHSSTVQGQFNTAIGIGALKVITTGYGNTANGYRALYSNTTGLSNTANGSYSLQFNTTGNYNTANGPNTLLNNTMGSNNTANGSGALAANTTGGSNTANGSDTLSNNTTGYRNTANGDSALSSNKAKNESTAIGSHSMLFADNTTTSSISYNTALGAYSLQGSTTAGNNTGIQNTALGHSALMGMTSGSGNIGIGYNSGSAITTGSNNVVIGSDTGSSIATSSNYVLINDGAGNRRATIDNLGNVGIGTTTPRGFLEVAGGSIVGRAPSSTASTTIDFGTGNQQYTSLNCQAFVLNNMKSGASYALAIQGTSAATCSFTAYSDVATTGLTVHLPPDHTATIGSTHTLYNFMVMGTHVYVSWVPGY